MEPSSNGHSAAPTRRNVHVIGIHSYRGGSGKTTLAANLAYLVARTGAKVAVLDADLQAPELHILLGVEPKRILHSVSEFVKGQCELKEVPIDLSRELELEAGSLHFLPASTDIRAIASILFEGYDVARFHKHVLKLAEELELDYLILDTHLGINRETLLSLATSDTVLVLQRPDAQDQQGAGVLVQIAKSVGTACQVVPNMIPEGTDPAEVSARVEKELGAPVAGVLPWCAELSQSGCQQTLFAAQHQDHPFVTALERVAQQWMPVDADSGVGS
jgi:MinD-like ATPase involved in chromosome partitioning or flagellar assembly